MLDLLSTSLIFSFLFFFRHHLIISFSYFFPSSHLLCRNLVLFEYSTVSVGQVSSRSHWPHKGNKTTRGLGLWRVVFQLPPSYLSLQLDKGSLNCGEEPEGTQTMLVKVSSTAYKISQDSELENTSVKLGFLFLLFLIKYCKNSLFSLKGISYKFLLSYTSFWRESTVSFL